MSSRRNVSVSPGPELNAVAERMLASGRHGYLREVAPAVPRLLDERERAFQVHADGQGAGRSTWHPVGA